MSITEQEIMGQYEALARTVEYFQERGKELWEFGKHTAGKRLIFIGCGSGYCLCRSAAVSAGLRLPAPAHALAAGDLLLNFADYEPWLHEALIIAPTRSGSTSEVVQAVARAKAEAGAQCLAITARQGSELGRIADLDFVLPWAFDHSVCQTRTVTNLYAANLLAISAISDDPGLAADVRTAAQTGPEFMAANLGPLKEIAASSGWDRIVVLADAELEGIAMEAALAFTEIARVPASYHHLLDVRHGPMVMIDGQILVLIAPDATERGLQRDLIRDLHDRGARVIAVGPEANRFHADHAVLSPPLNNRAALGIPLIFVPQILACFKAYADGIDPDRPPGLEPWIKLS